MDDPGEGQVWSLVGVCKPSAGCGAIYELARIIDEFRRELPEPNLTYNVGMVLGGSQAQLNAGDTGGQASGKLNVIAAEALARGDIRTLSNEQEARVRGRMKAIVARHLDKTEAEIEFSDDGYPPMAPTEGNKALLARLNAVNATLDLPEMPAGDPANRGAGDISFVAFIDGLVGLGMAGEGSHAAGRDRRSHQPGPPGQARRPADHPALRRAARDALGRDAQGRAARVP